MEIIFKKNDTTKRIETTERVELINEKKLFTPHDDDTKEFLFFEYIRAIVLEFVCANEDTKETMLNVFQVFEKGQKFTNTKHVIANLCRVINDRRAYCPETFEELFLSEANLLNFVIDKLIEPETENLKEYFSEKANKLLKDYLNKA